MNLSIKQRILLELLTVLAFVFAPLILALSLVLPALAFIWEQIWATLNFPYNLRRMMLYKWGKLDLHGNPIEPNNAHLGGNGKEPNN
jgi:hypothetical protein